MLEKWPQKSRLWGLIKDLLTNGLHALSNEEYQRRIWFRMEGPEVGSYIDTVCYFISRCESIFEDPYITHYLDNERQISLKQLYELVIEHLDLTESRILDANLIKEDELLNNPNWHDIQSLAELNYYKLSEIIGEDN